MKPINEQTELELTETVEALLERVHNESLWHILSPLVEDVNSELRFWRKELTRHQNFREEMEKESKELYDRCRLFR